MAIPRIFVNYYFAGTANRDYQVAMQLVTDLRARGAEVVAEEATVPNEQVNAYLNQELPQCQWFILILTPEAVNSPRVRWEVDTALNMHRQGRMMGLLALWLVPPDLNAIPPTWRSVLHSCDGSQNYQDGLFQVLQIVELPQHHPSSLSDPFATLVAPFPPTPNEDEESDTLVPRREDNQNTEWAGPTQRYGQQGTGSTQRYSQDISGTEPVPGYGQNVQGGGPTPRHSQDMPTQRHSQDIPGADPFHGYDQNAPNPAFFQPKDTPFVPRPSSFSILPRQWLILIAVVLVVLLVAGFLITIVGHLGSSLSGTPVDASKNATATAAVANANATAIAMASTPQGLYTLVMQRQPTLSDSLTAQDNNQWDVNSSQTGGCAFTGGAYHASVTAANQHTACMSRKAEFKNFAYQVQMTLISGDAGGLIFRSDNAVSTFYRFAIDSTGAYRLFSCKGCTGNQNAGNALSVGDIGVKANQPNTLTVIAINNTINLYVNGQFVKGVNDATSDAGELGVYAGTFVQAFMHPTEVAFSNVKIWAL